MPIVLTILIAIVTILLAIWPKIQEIIKIRKDIKEEENFDKMLDDLSKEYQKKKGK